MLKPLRTLFAPAPPPVAERDAVLAAPAGFWQIDERLAQEPAPGTTYELSLDTFFQARHSVTINGTSGPPHEHTYRVQVRCSAQRLCPVNHTLIGYQELRSVLQEVARAYDGQTLNDLPPFHKLQPTSEVFTAVLFQQLDRQLVPLGLTLLAVTLWESPTIAITYTRPATR